MLEFKAVNASYEGFAALNKISLSIGEAERVGIFGHNGAGKTTLLKCAVGEHSDLTGTITFKGELIVPGEVHRNARRGIGFVPQGHNVFSDLTVAQNLRIAGLLHDPNYVSEIYRMFPVLRERSEQTAGSLSGGEQQMLALSMALMTRPSILLLDEPTTGLAPIVAKDVLERLMQINRQMKTAIVIVEQSVHATLRIIERAIVLKTGGVIFDDASGKLGAHKDLWEWF
jgi:branched-chain amino acid transport system ATP-binding protein